MPLATIGVFLLFLGWFGFNGGSVLNAILPCITSICYDCTGNWRWHRCNLYLMGTLEETGSIHVIKWYTCWSGRHYRWGRFNYACLRDFNRIDCWFAGRSFHYFL